MPNNRSTPRDSTPKGSTPKDSTPKDSTQRDSTPNRSTHTRSTHAASTVSIPRSSTPRASTRQGQYPPGQYPPGQYPPAGYAASGYPYAVAAGTRTNGMAIASLICAIGGVFFLGIPSILGIVFGFVARSQIQRSNGTQTGNGLALAGIIVGFCVVAAGILIVIIAAVSAHTCNTGNGFGSC